MFTEVGKILILIGLILLAAGLALTYFPSLRLGRLPGDLSLTFKNGKLYFPLATCLLLSIALSLIFWLISKFR